MPPAGTDGGPELRAGATPGDGTGVLHTALAVLACGVAYYLATRIAWLLCFPDSKVSLFFPPHAVLVSILLLVPTRHWWAYVLAAAGSHFLATQQAGWPPLYALHCEAFDATKSVLAAAGIRRFVRSPFHRLSLREAVFFVLVAVFFVPAATSLWGSALTLANGFGSSFWVEWRNLAISNGVTSIILVPALLIGVHQLSRRTFELPPRRVLEAALLALGIALAGGVSFLGPFAGPDTSPALLYTPVPLLLWAALRFGLGGVSASMLGITTLAIWGTMRGRGPFLAQSPVDNALALQMFLLMLATPLMLLAVAIADERRSKEALRVSEERVSLAVESGQLALWDWDVATDTIWMTEEGRKIFDFEPREPLRYSSLADRVHPDDRDVRAAAIQGAIESGGSFDAQYRLLLPDGSVRWIAARGRCTEPVAGGTPGRLLGVSMDVTRQKRADAEVQLQREELAHLSRVASVNALSGSLAHELSQPLSSILSDAQTGERLMAQDSPDLGEIREIFADIVTADRRAVAIIDRLRTMLRRGEVALQAVDVGAGVEELLRLIRSDLIVRGVSVSNLVPGELPPALTDRVQLQQVLLNLIVNACDAMGSNPPEERHLTLTARVEENELHIGVLDRGIGLPDDVEALFQPFQTSKEGGLGMGLSICRMLIASHGGRLWAERRAGGGAAFFVALPLAGERI
jgi:signal transduction histidine kinase